MPLPREGLARGACVPGWEMCWCEGAPSPRPREAKDLPLHQRKPHEWGCREPA